MTVCDMQEGILKKINKDRNAKTTRNIQEGLPFDISDVKRQTEDAGVLQAVSISLWSVINKQYSSLSTNTIVLIIHW